MSSRGNDKKPAVEKWRSGEGEGRGGGVERETSGGGGGRGRCTGSARRFTRPQAQRISTLQDCGDTSPLSLFFSSSLSLSLSFLLTFAFLVADVNVSH